MEEMGEKLNNRWRGTLIFAVCQALACRDGRIAPGARTVSSGKSKRRALIHHGTWR